MSRCQPGVGEDDAGVYALCEDGRYGKRHPDQIVLAGIPHAGQYKHRHNQRHQAGKDTI
jgi:hypothetical protein